MNNYVRLVRQVHKKSVGGHRSGLEKLHYAPIVLNRSMMKFLS